jgi:hypothetical protein
MNKQTTAAVAKLDGKTLQWVFENNDLSEQQQQQWIALESCCYPRSASGSLAFAVNAHLVIETPVIFALGYVDNELAISIPLTIKPISHKGMNYQCLQTVSHNHLDFFIANGQQQFSTNELIESLTNACKNQIMGWHLFMARRWYFPDLPRSSVRSSNYSRQAAFYSLENKTDAKQVAPKKMLKNIARFEKKLQAEGGLLSLKAYYSEHNVSQSLDSFLELESSGWKGEAGSAISKNQQLRQFYQSCWSEFARSNNAIIFVLKLDDKPVASAIAFRSLDTLFLHKIAYDESLSAFAPGSILIKQILEFSLSQQNLVKLSFNTNPPWVNRWHPQIDELHAIQNFNRNPKGLFLRIAFRTLDQLKLIKRSIKANK